MAHQYNCAFDFILKKVAKKSQRALKKRKERVYKKQDTTSGLEVWSS